TPKTIRRAERRRMMNRFFRLNPMRSLSIVGSSPGALRSIAAPGSDGTLRDLGLEQEGTLGDNLLARFEAPGHLHHIRSANGLGHDPLRTVSALVIPKE